VWIERDGCSGRKIGVGMSETVMENVLAQLQRRNPRYAESAYLFVLTALHGRLAQMEVPRHISGPEVADAVRSLALERFGPMARTVLEHWGVHSTTDMGEIVFALVDCGVLIKQPHDSREDFEDLFTFEEAFEHSYPWGR
jgi:uncharacterized repeat protein (TIGR04138 family)